MSNQTVKEQGMSLFKIAVEARVPIIGIHTEDVMYLPDLFTDVLGVKPHKLDVTKINADNIEDKVYYLSETSTPKINGSLVTAHQIFEAKGASLILVNPAKPHATIFDVGLVTPTKGKIKSILKEVTGSEESAVGIMNQIGSMGIKQVNTAAALTMARDKSLTVEGMAQTRKTMFQNPKGVVQLSLQQDFYIPTKAIESFAKKEKEFFLEATDRRMRPRGILLDGMPGTGKTEAVKWLARQWGVSAFRLDIATVQDKYVGESQRFLANALKQIEAETPCILLVDEVEKVMRRDNRDSSGTKADMLSQLLWWLQEHDHRILTMMTTNDKEAIPKELIRPGRIDKQIFVQGLTHDESVEFLGQMLGTFSIQFETGDEESDFIDAVVTKAFTPLNGNEQPDRVAHAHLSGLAIEAMKNYFNPAMLKG